MNLCRYNLKRARIKNQKEIDSYRVLVVAAIFGIAVIDFYVNEFRYDLIDQV